MKKLALALTALVFLQAQELEVEGNLKVQGNIDASNQRVTNVGSPTDLTDAVNTEFLQDALRDDGNYEYEFYQVQHGNGNYPEDWQYWEMGISDAGVFSGKFVIDILKPKLEDSWLIYKTINLGAVGCNGYQCTERMLYVEGAGQLCSKCWNETYTKKD